MNYPPYPFVNLSDTDEAVFYAFTSISQHRAVQKATIFTPYSQNLYNMALVDILESGELSDTIVSDNQDIEQVLSTSIQILLDFLQKRPTVSVLFTGSTPSRTRLYRAVISKYLPQISELCQVEGITRSDEREQFRPNQNYSGFVVSLLR